MSSDTTQITTLLTSYATALSSRDVSLAVSLYTSDGVIMPPHFPPSCGSQALTESYARIFSSVHLNIAFSVDEVVVTSPGWGFARTTARGTKKMLASGEEEEHANQELFVVKKEDGEWRIARYAFSSMKPLVQNGVRRS